MPQGGLEEGEDPEAGALRELHEETGMRSVRRYRRAAGLARLRPPAGLQGKAWGGRYRGQKQKWYAARFVGKDGEIDIAPAAGHQIEFDRWRWAPIGELIAMTVPSSAASTRGWCRRSRTSRARIRLSRASLRTSPDVVCTGRAHQRETPRARPAHARARTHLARMSVKAIDLLSFS